MIDDKYFNIIDEPIKAYILGLIVFNIKSHDNNKLVVEIIIDNSNIDFIYKHFSNIGECIYINDNILNLTITSENIISDIKNLINVSIFSSIYYIDITHFINSYDNNNIKHAFIKAYIENNSNILNDNNNYDLNITFYLDKNTEILKNLFNIPYEKKQVFNLINIIYNNVNIIDLMGILYKNNIYTNTNLYKWYNNIIKGTHNNDSTIKIFKTDVNAIIPSKNRMSDAGYDITVIKESKKFNEKTTLYDTGIKLNIPNGYYVEIVPRSSLSKSGYMLANSIGIIDQSYRGNIFVALTKINETSDDIILPFCCCQMIIKKQVYSDIIESLEDFSITNRNKEGYGDASLKKISI